jgi:hypothetical protein
MVEGLAAKAIAKRLGVATKTVENHKIRIFDKLGVRTHAQAVSVTISQGLLATTSLLVADDVGATENGLTHASGTRYSR